MSVEAVAPDARWLVACQARNDTNSDGRVAVSVNPQGDASGDRLLRYLALGSGEEQGIDDLLASSRDGRYLVLRLAPHVELYDSVSGARRDLGALGADTRSEPFDAGPHRTLAFTQSALFYVRARDAGSEVVEQKLENGSERVLYTSLDPIVRMRLDVAEKLILLSVARAENARNRRFVWPYRLESEARACRGPGAHFLAPNPNADPLATVVVDIERASGESVDGLAGVLGGSLLRRDGDGVLWLTRGTQKQRIADKTCAGRLLHADAPNDVLLIGCVVDKRPGRLNVELVSRNLHKPLDAEVAALGDEVTRAAQRLVPLYPGADCALFDSEKQALHRLHTGDAVLATHGGHALVRRAKALLVFDADAASETPLPAALDAFGEVLVQGALVYASPWLIDLDAGRVRGQLAGKVLALAASGALLVPAVAATERTLSEGPLTWRMPE